MQRQNAYFIKEREIDIKTMLISCIRRWRGILIAAAIGAVIACAVKYQADVSAAEAAINNQIEAANAPEITVEYLEEKLGESQVASVQNALDHWNYIERKNDYMEHSVWFNLNAYAVDAVFLTYQVSAEHPAAVINDCKRFATGEEMVNGITQDLGLSLESQYVLELLSISASDNTTCFTVRVYAENAESCALLADSVDKQMKNYAASFSADGTQISLKERDAQVVVDAALAGTQAGHTGEINNMLNTFNGYMQGLGEEQHTLFELLVKENAVTSLFAGESGEEETPEGEKGTPVEIDTTIHVRPSVRMAVIGFAAGAIAAYAVFMLLYTVSKNIHGTDEVKYLFGIPVFGTVNTITVGKKRLFGKTDLMLDRLLRGKKYLSYEEELSLAAEKIRVYCDKQERKEIYACGVSAKNIPADCLDKLAGLLAADGIAMTYGSDVCRDKEAIKKASETGGVLLVEADEKTGCGEIAKELNICRQSGIEVIGVILAQVF